jgi:hypothetical protein
VNYGKEYLTVDSRDGDDQQCYVIVLPLQVMYIVKEFDGFISNNNAFVRYLRENNEMK